MNIKVFEKKTGTAEDPEVWVEVDGIAYDVTSFLPEHPGGAAILRRFAGKVHYNMIWYTITQYTILLFTTYYIKL